MRVNSKIVIAGIGVKSAFGEDLAAFSRVMYQDRQLIFKDPYQYNKGDMVDVGVQALSDAGIPSDATITVWVCGILVNKDLKQDLTNRNYKIGNVEQPLTLTLGMIQAQTSLILRQCDIALVIAEDDLGVGALVVVPEHAVINGDCYGVLEGISQVEFHQAKTICRDVLSQAQITPREIGYLETNIPDLADWVLDSYRQAGYDLTCAWGSIAGDYSIDSLVDHNPQYTISGLIKTVYALYSRTLPAFLNWTMNGDRSLWEHTPFYTIQEARPWFIEPDKEKRYAAWLKVNHKNVAHIVLSEPRPERSVSPVKSVLGEKTVWLLPVTARNKHHLHQKMDQLEQRFDAGESLETISLDLISQYEEQEQAPYSLALVGRDREELRGELTLANKGVDKAFNSGRPYRTPRGSVFTAQPQGEGDIAFVYPGAFNSYVGFGREVLLHFPILNERLSMLISNVGRSLAERRLYPRSLERLTKEEREAWALRLARNPIAMIESGTTFAIAYSMIMREIFDVQPQSAMGYSLGEISMLWSAGVWSTGDAGSDAWHASPLFKTRLFGPKHAVREAWGIQPENDEFWSTYLLKAPVADVRSYVDKEPHVYLTIINLSEEVVIAGDGQGCRRIIDSLGCHAIKVPFDSVIHNEVVRSEYNTFVQLYTHPIHHKPDITFFSAADYAPLTLDSEALALAIADMTCKPVDLPRLVNTVYESGARVFIELGPQATCSRWIDRILRGKPHMVVPINRTGMGDLHGIITVLAQLITNRVSVNLKPLLPLYQIDTTRCVSVPKNDLPTTSIIQASISNVDLQPVPVLADEGVYVNNATLNEVPVYHSGLDNVYGAYVLPHQSQVAENHMSFLQARHHALQDTGALIKMQLEIAKKMLSSESKADYHQPHNQLIDETFNPSALYTRFHLREFAAGDVELCFGEDYLPYRGRRLPRIPNGDLLLMDRIIEIDGTRGLFDNEPSLLSEYDVADDAWFFASAPDDNMPPYAVLMEIALQPCGFLAAYLGSTLSTSHLDYYFRNLDGNGQILHDCDLRSKTIQNQVKLLSSISLKGIIMQRYQFVLSCDGVEFFKGEASFGYFTVDALADQIGLDKGESILPYASTTRYVGTELAVPPVDQMHGLDKCIFSSDTGHHGRGYILGEAHVNPNAWFYKCHFYQDPVMPGSLGVDLMVQALELSLRHIWQQRGYEHSVREYSRSYISAEDVTWKYRGQVDHGSHHLTVELHIKDLYMDAQEITAVAEGSLWVDALRIYEVDNLILHLVIR